MIDYIKNIIPRIQQYSKGLDKEEVFVEKTEPWIYVDENGNQHQYIFMRDKRLIMSFNGIVKTGKWELLPTNQLLINRIDDEILLDHLFVEKALLVLKLSGSKDLPFVLIDPQSVPDLNVATYLEKYEHQQEKINLPIEEQTYTLLDSGEIVGPEFYSGKKIKTKNGDILHGNYKTTRYSGREFCDIVNNQIQKVYYIIEYLYDDNLLKIEQAEFDYPSKGDKIVELPLTLLPINKMFKIKNRYTKVDSGLNESFTVKIDESYSIIKVRDAEIFTITIPILIAITAFALIMLTANSC